MKLTSLIPVLTFSVTQAQYSGDIVQYWYRSLPITHKPTLITLGSTNPVCYPTTLSSAVSNPHPQAGLKP
jgi:hypothetical protein